jgi:hypothetical protein
MYIADCENDSRNNRQIGEKQLKAAFEARMLPAVQGLVFLGV